MNWADYFYYDETSPTFLRWTVERRSGKHYQVIERYVGDVAGSQNASGEYASVKLDGVSYLVHRVIWELCNGPIPSNMTVDHEDGIRINNKLGNLRLVTKAVNARNHKRRADNSSGLVGVIRSDTCWRACWNEDGRWRNRSFSVAKYGEEFAKELAVGARTKAIERLNSKGLGYTERHGK